MADVQTEPLVSVEMIARELSRANLESDPKTLLVRWFPNAGEVRLAVVDPRTPPVEPDEAIAPFYFGPDVAGGVPFPLAIAMVAPQDDRHAPLPGEWGTWDNSVEVLRH
jgi:hypothetical protein